MGGTFLEQSSALLGSRAVRVTKDTNWTQRDGESVLEGNTILYENLGCHVGAMGGLCNF